MRIKTSLFLTCLGLSSLACMLAQVSELDWPIEIVSEGHGFTEVWQEESGRTNGLYILNNFLYGCEAGEEREIFRNRVYVLSLKNNKLDSLEFNFETPKMAGSFWHCTDQISCSF